MPCACAEVPAPPNASWIGPSPSTFTSPRKRLSPFSQEMLKLLALPTIVVRILHLRTDCNHAAAERP